MFKTVFGVLGLLIVFAIISSLAKSHPEALGRIVHQVTRVLAPPTSSASRSQDREQGDPKSIVGRTDDALQRQSVERYKRAEP
jgi:hypothetical protein